MQGAVIVEASGNRQWARDNIPYCLMPAFLLNQPFRTPVAANGPKSRRETRGEVAVEVEHEVIFRRDRCGPEWFDTFPAPSGAGRFRTTELPHCARYGQPQVTRQLPFFPVHKKMKSGVMHRRGDSPRRTHAGIQNVSEGEIPFGKPNGLGIMGRRLRESGVCGPWRDER